jgi:hypothetical protein
MKSDGLDAAWGTYSGQKKFIQNFFFSGTLKYGYNFDRVGGGNGRIILRWF